MANLNLVRSRKEPRKTVTSKDPTITINASEWLQIPNKESGLITTLRSGEIIQHILPLSNQFNYL